ncbi:Hypothetical protein FKW44_017301, partial [Caligus rogercresseyi]
RSQHSRLPQGCHRGGVMKKDVVDKAYGRFRYRSRWSSPLMGAILKINIYICVPFV